MRRDGLRQNSNVANGFVFNDPSGTSHNLAIGVGATSANVGEPLGAEPCPVTGPGVVVPTGSGAGDGKVWAQFTSSSASGLSVTAVQHWSVNAGSNPNVNGPVGPFTVTDEAGTTYFFDGNGTYDSANQLNWEPPYQIEDRNGNIISGVTDTLGRPMWQSASGGVNIGGLVYPPATCVGSCSGSNPVNYQVPSHLGWNGMSYLPGDTSVLCPTSTAIMSVSASSPSGIGAFALPTSTSSNPQQYNFYYGGNTNGGTANIYGLLNEVIYPDGGWVKYTWQMSNSPSVLISGSSPYSEMGAFEGQGQSSPGVFTGNPYPSACLIYYATPVLASRVVSYDGVNIAQTQTFQYQTTWGNGQTTWDWTAKQTYVTTTDNITGASYLTVYNYGPSGTPSGTTPFSVGGVAAEIPVETSVLYYSGTSTGSPLLRTVTKSWFDMFHLAEEDTTENGLTSKTVSSYQAPSPTSPFTLLTGKSEYDFGASAPTQTTTINYKAFTPNTINVEINNQQYPVAIPVPSQPSSVIVTNSAGSLAETDYGYDSYGSGLASVTAVQHDGSNYGAGMTNRGNLTSMTKKCFNCTNATTTYMYDLTGQPASMTDPCGNATCSDMAGANHATTYSFTDSPSGGNKAGNSNAYLTNVVYPKTGSITHQESFQYNYVFGDLTQSTDENNQNTIYKYTLPSGSPDPFDRLTQSSFPDGGITNVSYTDSPTSPSVATCQLITGSAGAACSATSPPTGWKVGNSLMDGTFHTKQTQLVSDPDGEDFVDIGYDGLGRKRTVSNPHRTSSASTDGTASTTYDPLGRPILVTEQDGSTVQTKYDQTCNIKTNTLGTTVIDEAGHQRTSCTDGLGRLVEVDEPGVGGPTIFVTLYNYDALGNLLCVEQHGGVTGGSGCSTPAGAGDASNPWLVGRELRCVHSPRHSQARPGMDAKGVQGARDSRPGEARKEAEGVEGQGGQNVQPSVPHRGLQSEA
jgi:YD repeat-containing protein